MKKHILAIALIGSIVSSLFTSCVVRNDRRHHGGDRDHRGDHHYYRGY